MSERACISCGSIVTDPKPGAPCETCGASCFNLRPIRTRVTRVVSGDTQAGADGAHATAPALPPADDTCDCFAGMFETPVPHSPTCASVARG